MTNAIATDHSDRIQPVAIYNRLTGLPESVGAPSFGGGLTAATATIANGASLSDAVAVTDGQIVRGIVIPAAWTAAQLSFDVSHDDGVTYTSLRDPAGNEHVNAVTVSTFIPFPTVVGVTHIKIRSGILGTVVAQGAQRLLTVLVG